MKEICAPNLQSLRLEHYTNIGTFPHKLHKLSINMINIAKFQIPFHLTSLTLINFCDIQLLEMFYNENLYPHLKKLKLKCGWRMSNLSHSNLIFPKTLEILDLGLAMYTLPKNKIPQHLKKLVFYYCTMEAYKDYNIQHCAYKNILQTCLYF